MDVTYYKSPLFKFSRFHSLSLTHEGFVPIRKTGEGRLMTVYLNGRPNAWLWYYILKHQRRESFRFVPIIHLPPISYAKVFILREPEHYVVGLRSSTALPTSSLATRSQISESSLTLPVSPICSYIMRDIFRLISVY
jgi:hypothetical protein